MKKSLPAEELDRRFDEGGDITEYLDLDSARPLKTEPKRVDVDFPAWMVKAMDKEADRMGITRQAFIKVVLAERLGEFGRT
jgi:hypothetical protein